MKETETTYRLEIILREQPSNALVMSKVESGLKPNEVISSLERVMEIIKDPYTYFHGPLKKGRRYLARTHKDV